jgi:hypothetical protein
MQGAFFRTQRSGRDDPPPAPPPAEGAFQLIQNVERRSAVARPIKALPDKSSQIDSSARDVWATTAAMLAAMSPRPYAAALAAARRTSIITTNTFMFQPVANVSDATSYLGSLSRGAFSPVQGVDQTFRDQEMEELVFAFVTGTSLG